MSPKAQLACGSRLARLLFLGALGSLVVLTAVGPVTSAFAQTPPAQSSSAITTAADKSTEKNDKSTENKPTEKKGVIDLLGKEYTFGLLALMIGLMGGVYYIFMDLGRRLQESGYLGPLAREAIANAEIARLERGLQDKLARGDLRPAREPNSDDFKRRYQIPLGESGPKLTPGVMLEFAGGTGTAPPGLGRSGSGIGWDSEQPYSQRQLDGWSAARLEKEKKDVEAEQETVIQELGKLKGEGRQDIKDEEEKVKTAESKLKQLGDEISKRFVLGYRQEQFETYQTMRSSAIEEEKKRVKDVLGMLDTSTFSGSWVFLLEFTTIVFIVYAVLSLGVLGVLDSQPIAAILAAVAGYVLGKSTTLRNAAGEEIRRGAEQPTALFDLLAKQEEARSSRDAEKDKLQHEADKAKLQQKIDELQRKIAQTTVAVPDLAKLSPADAEKTVREKGLLAEKTEVENSKDPGKVFQQQPPAGAEVLKGSTVQIFIAKKPA